MVEQKCENNISGRSPRFPRGKSPSPPSDELYSTVSPHSRGGGPSDFHYNLPSCASLEFCFLPSTGQDRVVHPGPPRLGRRHPIRRYQTTTAIGNNQTQLISSSLAIRLPLPLPQSPGDRPQPHPSSRSRPRAGQAGAGVIYYGRCSRSSKSLYLPHARLFFFKSWSEMKLIGIPSTSMISRRE